MSKGYPSNLSRAQYELLAGGKQVLKKVKQIGQGVFRLYPSIVVKRVA